MVVIKFREKRGGRILIKPEDKRDSALFQHCSNGLAAVTTRVYNKTVEPLLFAHGIGCVTTIDKVKRAT